MRSANHFLLRSSLASADSSGSKILTTLPWVQAPRAKVCDRFAVKCYNSCVMEKMYSSS